MAETPATAALNAATPPAAAAASWGLEMAKALVPLAWPILAAVVLCVLWRPVTTLVRALTLRVSQGAAFKTPWVEIGTVKISRQQGTEPPKGIKVAAGAGAALKASLDRYDADSAYVFLAHQAFRSKTEAGYFDVLIYPLPLAANDWLRNVDSVQYFFGFGGSLDVFETRDFAKNFAVAVTIYDPLTCAAQVRFKDGHKVMIARFVDFEMAPEVEPAAADLKDDKKKE